MTRGEHRIASADELDEGDHLVVEIEGREIGVFKNDGEFFAYANWCPHQAGPACEGSITGTLESTYDRDALEETVVYCREGEVLNCAWHGWEFDLKTGECLSRDGMQLAAYPVRVEDGDILLTV